jgi:hypothetical protein
MRALPSLILISLFACSVSTAKFKHPACLSALGVIFSSLISFLLIKVLKVVPHEHKDDITTEFYFKRIFPIGFSLAGTLAAGNLVYLYLSVSFIQVLANVK